MDKKRLATGARLAVDGSERFKDFPDLLRYNALYGTTPLRPVSLLARLGHAASMVGHAVPSMTADPGNKMNPLGLLGVVFAVAKLTGYLTWSWWLVLLPFYGPLVLSLALLGFGVVMALVAALLN